MKTEELVERLRMIRDARDGTGDSLSEAEDEAIDEAIRRIEARSRERSSMVVSCRKCLKQGASVKMTIGPDGETLNCPVHGADA